MQHSNNVANRNPINTANITTTIIIKGLKNLEAVLQIITVNAAVEEDQILIAQHGKPSIDHVIQNPAGRQIILTQRSLSFLLKLIPYKNNPFAPCPLVAKMNFHIFAFS